MRPLELYAAYTREEAVAILHPDGTTVVFSDGELAFGDGAGSLFIVVGQPPNHSYFLSGQVFRWFAAETDLQFYNSTMLSFRSRWRPAGRVLHLFGKLATERPYTYLGVLRVAGCDCPSCYGCPESPKQIIVQFDVEPQLKSEAWAKFDWTSGPVLINGLALPGPLKKAIGTGRWRHLAPDQMARHTDQLRYLDDKGYGACYAVGQSGKLGRDISDPNILDLDRAICLGDTGPDEPICLEYRNPASTPRVVHLAGNARAYWRLVAPNVETFIDQMNMCVS